MVIIGERINSTRSRIRKAILGKDKELIIREVNRQTKAGVDFIDLNAGVFPKDELEKLTWLTAIVQDNTDIPICLDSSNYFVLKELSKHLQPKCLINSIPVPKHPQGDFQELLQLASEADHSIIMLCMDGNHIPATPAERTELAQQGLEYLFSIGFTTQNVYVDPMVQPVGLDQSNGLKTIETIKSIRANSKDTHIICGLSNISYGLPQRKLINRTFATLAMASGLDSIILDPCDHYLMDTIASTELLLGLDPFCTEFIQKHKNGQFSG